MSTSATRKQSAAIQKRMQMIRNELPYAMDDARSDLRLLRDWKFYVSKLPFMSVACTAAAAYLAVPSKQIESPNEKIGAAGNGESNSHARVTKDEKESSFVGGLLGAAAAMAMRTGASLLVNRVSESLLGHRNGAPTMTKHSERSEA